ncbi:aldo/keto reductase [Cnuibacter physcomitrellae]|uniref:aldo/keto reductase n=1 Tax=Cnuibacter physcomitrellae TaxID=1619308 RepID=UPI00217611CC|nr:aldo/keto reductase [Cnuibacter physcomitrellae]MCS5497705.1 aldo/keto reductase [Cnuibacter physcomitrellae]
MDTTTLGRTGMQVAPVSFGTAPLGQLFGPVPEERGAAVVAEAIDLGITFFDTSPYYGDAEERLGRALKGRRDRVLIGTKAGRNPGEVFDFSPTAIRRSVEESLRRLRTDHVDVLQLHDIEFVDLGPVLTDGYETLVALRDEGKCLAIGMTGYSLATARRVIAETDCDVFLNFGHGTLLDGSLSSLGDLARSNGVALVNAAAVALGLLTPAVRRYADEGHMAPTGVVQAALRMSEVCEEAGASISFLANQYAIQRGGAVTTVIGTTTSVHLREAVEAATTTIDEELLAAVLALRPDPAEAQWDIGLPENS